MKKTIAVIHGTAAALAFAIILAFMFSSATVEIFGSPQAIASVKYGIRWGLLALVPALAATGISGYALVAGKPKGLAQVKFARMRAVGMNGILVLVPAVFFLAWKAGHGEFDLWFTAIQAVEYLAGATNLALMCLNMRDGFRLSGRFRRQPVASLNR